MKKLFNKNFFKFTLGFITILIASFAFASIVSSLNSNNTMSANVTTSNSE